MYVRDLYRVGLLTFFPEFRDKRNIITLFIDKLHSYFNYESVFFCKNGYLVKSYNCVMKYSI